LKTSKKPVCYALAAVLTLSVTAGSSTLGLFGVDSVSAATAGTTAKTTTTKVTTPKAQSTTQTATVIERILKRGSYGSEVKLLQTVLNNNGYKLKVNGVFGKKTLAAIKSFQSENGLTVDGIVGPKTLAVLTPAPVATASEPVVVATPAPVIPTTPPIKPSEVV
jgi:peptidoglycan hydrolase-like protein with peptidoglycan-binding domain